MWPWAGARAFSRSWAAAASQNRRDRSSPCHTRPVTDSITIDLDRAIAFRTRAGDSIAAYGVALELTGDGTTAPPAARLTFRVAPDVYDRIVDESLFGLAPDVRGEPPSPFTDDRELELVADLRPRVAAELIARGGGAEDLVGALLAADAPAAFVARTDSWQTHSVVQEDESGVRSGFETFREPMLEVARRAAEDAGTPLEDAGDGLHRFAAHSREGAWTTLVWIDEDARVCAVYAVAAERVPVERRAEVAQFLVDRNYYLNVGAFEMDLDDGEVRLRTSIDATHATFDDQTFVNLVAANLEIFELHLPTLRELAAGTISLAGARARF